MKRKFRSQRREMLLFLITYTAAVTSRVNLHGTIPSADWLRNTALHSLRTADPFLVVASLPPEKSYFSEGEKRPPEMRLLQSVETLSQQCCYAAVLC